MDNANYQNDPYFLQGEEKLSEKQRREKKENFIYLIRLLINLYDNEGRLDVHAVFLTQIMCKKMPHTTCPEDDALAVKIKKLVLAMDYPEKRAFFMRSCFVRAFFELRAGSYDQSARWANYKPTAEAVKEKRHSPLMTALHCYLEDPTIPVGPDIHKCFDALVKKEGEKFFLKNPSAEEGRALVASFRKFTDLLQNGKDFKRYFVYGGND